MTLIRGYKCPACERGDRIIEVEDKSGKPLYYAMSGAPVYKKGFKCGNCGHLFEKPE